MFKHLIFMLGLTAGCSLAQAQTVPTEAWYAVPDARGVQVINIECGAVLDPPDIVVKSGLPVELRVRSRDASQEFGSDFAPGKRSAIGRQFTAFRFTPGGTGQFKLHCSKKGGGEHAAVESRKTGRLTVVPDNKAR